MKKRIIFLACSVALVIGMLFSLASCGSSANADGSTEPSANESTESDTGYSGETLFLNSPSGEKPLLAVGIACTAIALIAAFLIFDIEVKNAELVVFELCSVGAAAAGTVGAAIGFFAYFLGNAWLVAGIVLAASAVILSGLAFLFSHIPLDDMLVGFLYVCAEVCMAFSFSAFTVYFISVRLLILGLLAFVLCGVMLRFEMWCIDNWGDDSVGTYIAHVFVIALFIAGAAFESLYIFKNPYYGLALGGIAALLFSEMAIASDMKRIFSCSVHGVCGAFSVFTAVMLGMLHGPWVSVSCIGVSVLAVAIMYFLDRVFNTWRSAAMQAVSVALMPLGFFAALSGILAKTVAMPYLSLGIASAASALLGTAMLLWYALHKKYGMRDYRISDAASRSLMITGLSSALLFVVTATVFIAIHFVF